MYCLAGLEEEATVRLRHFAVGEAINGMKRRGFIALAGGAVGGWVASARAQAMPVIGYLGSETQERYASRLEAFRKGLEEAGYVEGRNVAIEYKWGEDQYSRLPALAKDLVGRKVTVIVAAGGAEVALAAKAATQKLTTERGTMNDSSPGSRRRRIHSPTKASSSIHKVGPIPSVENQQRGPMQSNS